MSMKNTYAHGKNWHLYEEFGTMGGLYLQVDNTTLFLSKEILKSILPSLRKLETEDWKLIGEEEITNEQIENFIEVLQKMKKQKVPEGMKEVSPGLYVEKKSTSIFKKLADLEGDATPFASNSKHLRKNLEEWLPENDNEE